MATVTNKAASPEGWRLWRKKATVSGDGKMQQSAENIITYEAVGLITLFVMGSRKTGWAEYDPLRRYKGGEAGSRR
jgi:hypothetical protein